MAGTMSFGDPDDSVSYTVSVGIEPGRFVLGEVLHDHLMTDGSRSRVRRLLSGQHAHERGLAGAVRSDQRNAIAALDVQGDVAEHGESIVGLARVLQLEDGAPALHAVGKAEVNPLALWRNLDRHHFLEQLDAALHLRRFRRLIAEAVDEHLDARDFLVLFALRLTEPLEHRVAQLDVLAVVADVVGQLPEMDVGDPRHDRVEEVAIVRDENHRVRVGAQVFLEPVARLEIEMVRRLVQQQEVRPARGAAWRARSASASRLKTSRTDARSLRARTRVRAARSRCADPCCSRRRA